VYLLVLSVTNVVFLVVVERNTGATLILMQRVFHSILTGRILLHIRMALIQDRKPANGRSVPIDLTSMFGHTIQIREESFVAGQITSEWSWDTTSSIAGSFDSIGDIV